MKKILVTGGNGYIGSHTVVDLVDKGYEVIIIDNFSNSEKSNINNIETIIGKKLDYYNIDLTDKEKVENFFKQQKNIESIIHFAAYIYVEESVEDPLKYYVNNLLSLTNIIEVADKNKVKNFVFSSSCAVFGNIDTLPVNENTKWNEAQSPYAKTKQMGELILNDFAKISEMKIAILRYFNPIGAHDSSLIGEPIKQNPSHIIPRITATAIGKFENFKIFGTNLDTRDGSCIRDYIHVMDLAEAHTSCIGFLDSDKSENINVFNIGSGDGISVKEAIFAFEKTTNLKLNVEESSPRLGDVVAIYSDVSKAEKFLGWKTKRNIDDMMYSAWKWELKNNNI